MHPTLSPRQTQSARALPIRWLLLITALLWSTLYGSTLFASSPLASSPLASSPIVSSPIRVAEPLIIASLPPDGATIDEEQVFILQLNSEVQPDSLIAHARCEAEGIHEQLPLQLISGDERKNLLQALKEVLADYNFNTDAASPHPLQVVRCQRTLPANAKMTLVWGAGIATPTGQQNPTDQRLQFNVRDHFVANLRCQRENAKAGCIPLTPIRLQFTAPVARALLNQITLKDGKNKSYPQQKDAQPAAMDDSVTFNGPFPAHARLDLSLPEPLLDDKGRTLVNGARFPLRVTLAEIPPLLKFSGDFGIIERNAGGLLPVTLRNLEPSPSGETAAKIRWLRLTDDAAILAWQQRLHQFDHPQYDPNALQQPDQRKAQLLTPHVANVVERTLPKPNGALAFEVVGVPLLQPGFYIVEAESRRLGQSLLDNKQPMFVRSSALVTNLAVHFKWGAATSLAWVTQLDSGTPVANARIAVRDCRGRLLAESNTDTQGMALLPQKLPDPRAAEYDCPLFVSARHGDDLSFARSDWDEGIETWRFGLPQDWERENRIAHSLLDRALFRAGETVHMKHLLREKRDSGLKYATALPPTLQIEHRASNQRWFLPLSWKNGAANTHWTLPLAAQRGDYQLRLLNKAITTSSAPEQLEYLEGLDSGSFSVSDFRVPLLRAEINPRQATWLASSEAEFDLSVRYLNGGGARQLPVKLRAQLEPQGRIQFDHYADYDFALAPDDRADNPESDTFTLPTRQLKLDANGSERVRIDALPALTQPHRLKVEMEFADPNGEIQTVSTKTEWWPASIVLGLKNDDWVRAGKRHTLRFLAVDIHGKPAANVPIEASFALRQTLSHRIRLAGGFYGYHSETQVTPLAISCSGVSNAKGQFTCQAQSEQGGEVVVSARALDSSGRASTSTHSFWVAGRDDWVFPTGNHDRIDLIPEKKRYEPGETARLQVRMPFRNATALITVEREGIIEARVVNLDGKAPVLDIPIKANWAPNVFVSALVVRGRNDAIKPTALIDLGRPSFKLGIAQLAVGHRAHQLQVEIKTDRSRYQVREKARATVKVRTPEGTAPPAGTLVTLAAVDEGLLELAPNPSWNALDAMMATRGYSMRTFTAQMQVTGKRHFGKKALPAGGGGGKSPTRELFDTLLFWQADIALNAQGDAVIDIPLNDSLTAFRLVAIAVAENRFGSGKTSLRSTQDLQLISGLSPLVRQGDQLQAYFSVRNGSARSMKIEVTAAANVTSSVASALLPLASFPLPIRTLSLAAGETREIVWPLAVPATVPTQTASSLDWTLQAKEIGGKSSDSLKVKQTLQAAVPTRVQTVNLYRLNQTLEIPITLPADHLPASGELRATFSAGLADGQTALRDYMRRYPYNCLEQKVSRAVATQNRAAWEEISASLPTYLTEAGLLHFFPVSHAASSPGSMALSAYVLAIADQTGWSLPLDVKSQLHSALIRHLNGQSDPARSPGDNPIVLRLSALEAIARAGLVTPELISTIKPQGTPWPTSALIDWISILQKTPSLPDSEALRQDALTALEARMNASGKRLDFSREADDALWWMMTSADTNAVRSLLTLSHEASWKERLPKLVSGSLARQKHGRWNTTTANAWGVLALTRYQQLFEAVKPAGKTHATLDTDSRIIDWQAFPKGATAFLPLNNTASNLRLKHEGKGQPYVSVTTLAAVPLTQPVQRGYSIKRQLIPIDQKTTGIWRRGDVVRVRLDIEAKEDMGWLVVEDPIPTGASILSSSGLRGSTLLTQGENSSDKAVWPTWQERLFDSYRAYYEYAPRGIFSLEYTLRLNSDGQFQMPTTRVEAMYAPEVFAEIPNAVFEVAK